MVESTKLAEFRFLRNQLINALAHISFANKAAIGLIKDPSGKNIWGISFNNSIKGSDSGYQFDIFATYPIFNDEMVCKTYFIENLKDWPVFYIATTPGFINSVSTLPPIITSDEDEVLSLVLWNLKDDGKTMSEAMIFGNHHSSTQSVIEHSDKVDENGAIVQASANGSKNIEIDSLRSYI